MKKKQIVVVLLALLCVSMSGFSQTTILATNTTWKYKSDGSNQGTVWRSTTFSDASWSSGTAELGYGDAPVTTLSANKITYYFRRTVSITNPSQYSSFTMKLRRDDGIVVYVNNVEVYRSNMPTGTITYTTPATIAASDDGATIFTTTLASAYFVNGNNVIAVEVHNNATSSSDLTFELQLLANPASSCTTSNVALFETRNKTATSATPWWVAVAGATSYNVQYRIRNVGANYSASINTTTNSAVLNNLQPSTNYEFIVQTVCSSGSSAFSTSGWFTTLSPSCTSASGLSASNISTTSATITWGAVTSAASYNIQYRIAGTSIWTSTSSLTTSISLTGLTVGTSYEFQVQTVCTGSLGTSSFSSSFNFATTNGGLVGVPAFSHIVVVIGENTSATTVSGDVINAPYINSLMNTGANFTQYYATAHPSQTNYIQLFSGNNQGVTNNNLPSAHFTTPNLARELLDAGKTFESYSDGLPSTGYDGEASGSYVRKHNPVTNWMGTGNNQVSSSINKTFSSFPTDYTNLPHVSFVIPDLCNDGHDLCAPYNHLLKQYDTWLQANLDSYKQWCINNNSLLVVTWDEDDGTGVNRVVTAFYGAHVLPGNYSQTINHYSLLRFMEDANGLTTHAGDAASAVPINFCWSSLRKAESAIPDVSDLISVYPNPASDQLHIKFNQGAQSQTAIHMYNLMGKEVYGVMVESDQTPSEVLIDLKERNIAPGLYILQVANENSTQTRKIIIR